MAPEFRARGFRRRGYHWYRSQGDAIQVVGLYPDHDTPGWVELMLGTYWRTIPSISRRPLPAPANPRVTDCHFRTQLSQLLARDWTLDWVRATDLQAIQDQFLQPMQLVGFPWLNRFSRLHGAIDALRGAEPTVVPMGSVQWMYLLACLLASAGEAGEAHYMAQAIDCRDPHIARVLRQRVLQVTG